MREDRAATFFFFSTEPDSPEAVETHMQVINGITPVTALVGIVDADTTYVKELSSIFDSLNEVRQVLHWTSAEECLEDREAGTVDLFFVRSNLPGMDGYEFARQFSESHPQARILMITPEPGTEDTLRSFRCGALGSIAPGDPADMRAIVKHTLQGGAILTASLARGLLGHLRALSHQVECLTPRENQVLDRLILGNTPAQIGQHFGTAEGTVRQQVKSIYRKLQVKSRVQLMRRARELQLL